MRPKNPDVRIFVSYSHRDGILFRDSIKAICNWSGVAVIAWADDNIDPGSDWDKRIRAELERTDIFLALITTHFAASSYIHEVEVPIAERRHKKGETLIAPVVVSEPGGTECDWLFRFERLPHKTKSWVEMRKESVPFGGDDALKPLRDGIKKLVDQVRASRRP